jgi:hypothetical protein
MDAHIVKRAYPILGAPNHQLLVEQRGREWLVLNLLA